MMRKTHKKKNASCDASTHASPETTNKKVKSVGGGKETRSWPTNSPSLHPPLAGYLAPRCLHCRRRLVGGSRLPGAGRYPSPRRRLSTSDGGAALSVVRPAGAPIIHQVTSGSERRAAEGVGIGLFAFCVSYLANGYCGCYAYYSTVVVLTVRGT